VVPRKIAPQHTFGEYAARAIANLTELLRQPMPTSKGKDTTSAPSPVGSKPWSRNGWHTYR
jgi:hypothetical protein